MDGGHRTRFAGATPAAGATLFDSVTGEEGLYVSETPAIGVMYDTFVGFDPSRPGKRLSATKRVDEHGVAHFVSAPRSVQRKGLHATARGWTPRPSEYNTVVAAAAELAELRSSTATRAASLSKALTDALKGAEAAKAARDRLNLTYEARKLEVGADRGAADTGVVLARATERQVRACGGQGGRPG